MKYLRGGSCVFLLFVSHCLAQTLVTSWDGAIGDPSGPYPNHPDPQVCVGPYQVLQVTGQEVTAWDKSGNLVPGYPVSMPSFLAKASPAIPTSNEHDPRCTYNEFAARFMVAVGTVGTGAGPTLFVSTGSDLSTSKWNSKILNTKSQSGDTTPHIGWNKWWTVISHADLTGASPYLAYAIPNSDVAASPIDLANMAGPIGVELEVFAAIDRSPTTLPTDPLYMIGRGSAQSCSTCNALFHMHTVTGADSTHPVISGATDIVTSGSSLITYASSANGPNQPGSTTPIRSAESHRITSLIQANGHVYGSLETGPLAGETYNGFVAFDIHAATASMGNVKRVFGGSTDAYLFISVALDGAGNIFYCGTRYSNTIYGSLTCWYSSDGIATVKGPNLIYPGSQPYLVVGWGTYGATVLDPADTTKIWMTQQYGYSTTRWGTRVAEVTLFGSSPATTIQTSPPGLQFSVDGGAPQAAPQTLTLSQGQHTVAVAGTQGGAPGTQYLFTGWSDGGTPAHSITVGNSAATYTANFQTQYQLSVSASPVNGGTVTPASAAWYDSGATVPVSATANSGFAFTGWSGTVAAPFSASTAVTMNGPQTLTANFVTGATNFPAFFDGQAAVGNGLYYLQLPGGNPFGYFNYLAGGWIYHADLGLEYVSPASSGPAAYLWDASSGHWLYTTTALFPEVYDFTLNAWLEYLPDTRSVGHYSSNPRYFLNLITGLVFTL